MLSGKQESAQTLLCNSMLTSTQKVASFDNGPYSSDPNYQIHFPNPTMCKQKKKAVTE